MEQVEPGRASPHEGGCIVLIETVAGAQAARGIGLLAVSNGPGLDRPADHDVAPHIPPRAAPFCTWCKSGHRSRLSVDCPDSSAETGDSVGGAGQEKCEGPEGGSGPSQKWAVRLLGPA